MGINGAQTPEKYRNKSSDLYKELSQENKQKNKQMPIEKLLTFSYHNIIQKKYVLLKNNEKR